MELWQIDVVGGVRLTDGTQLSVVTGIDDHSRFCVIAKVVPRATARPVCDALLEGLSRHGVPEQILTEIQRQGVHRKAGRKPANVLFDRICLNNGVRHLLTAPYSPTTRGKIERLHKTMLQAFLARETFASIEQAQEDLARWVQHYSHRREHQGIGDVAPIRRFELAMKKAFDVVAGEQVAVESKDGLLHVAHNGVMIATHARRHLLDDDDKMDRRPKNPRPQRPTTGGEVLRQVDASGSVSFAGCGYRVGNRHRGQTVDVRLVGDTIQITRDGQLLRTHRARHDKSKEFGALAKPTGRPRRNQDVA